jgi:hypothetical protein
VIISEYKSTHCHDCRGYRPLQTGSNISLIYIEGIRSLSTVAKSHTVASPYQYPPTQDCDCGATVNEISWIFYLLHKLVFAGHFRRITLLVPFNGVCKKCPAVGYCCMWWHWISMVIKLVLVRLWSNTNPERGEAPIGQIPIWAEGGEVRVRRNHYRYISFGRFTPRSPQTGTVYHQLVTESGNSEYIAF